MKPSIASALWVLAVIVLTGCASSPAAPAPPPIARETRWLGEQTLTSFTGGECLASTFEEALVGLPGEFHATLAQSETALTGELNIDHAGIGVCTYTGSINGDALELSTTNCKKQIELRCPDGRVRQIQVISDRLHGTVDGDRISGTATETLNILAAGTSTSVGTFVGNSSFVLTRQ